MSDVTDTLSNDIHKSSVYSRYRYGSVGDYFQLLKPRVMSLVVFTALCGMILVPSSETDPFLAFIAIICIAVGAGASGALNMWYDSDIDSIMSRTKNRPIPAGKISKTDALQFGLVLSFLSVYLLGFAVNWAAAGLLAFTIFFYAVIYSMWLKRSTPQNIVIGGAAGALPPVVGWVAMTGEISLYPLILFAIIFMWTPPHFWALALFKKIDYSEANIPMMPNVAGDHSTRTQILIYSVLLCPIAISPSLLGYAGQPYLFISTALGIGFIFKAFKVYKEQEDTKECKQLFAYSLLYMAGIFLTLILEKFLMNLFVSLA